MLKHHNHRLVSHFFGAIFVVAVSIVASAAYGVGDSSEEAQATAKLRPELYARLMEVQNHIASDEADDTTYATALDSLKQFETDYEDESLTDYELAQLNNLAGYTSFLRSDYPSAIASYERVVELTNEVPALKAAALKTIAQLYFTIGDYEQALARAKQLEEVIPGDPPPDVWMLIGQAYFQLEQYESALPYVDLAVEQIESQSQVPKENWLLLQKVSLGELGDMERMEAVLEKLIALYPKPGYERMLEGMRQEIQQQKEIHNDGFQG